MSSMEKSREATEQIARDAEDMRGMVLDHALDLDGRNVGLARKWLDGAAGEVREQSRSSQDVAQRLAQNHEVRREAFRELAEESLDSYMEWLFAPFSYYRQGLRRAEDNVRSFPGIWSAGDGFPIRGYDELSVAGISRRLDGLSAGQIQQVREYEKRSRSRESLIEQLDRKIRNAS